MGGENTTLVMAVEGAAAEKAKGPAPPVTSMAVEAPVGEKGCAKLLKPPPPAGPKKEGPSGVAAGAHTGRLRTVVRLIAPARRA